MLLAFGCGRNFELFQMDVKGAFLISYIMDKVYAQQPPSFENNIYPNHVFKFQKALYGLK